jgi:hypothetical protein
MGRIIDSLPEATLGGLYIQAGRCVERHLSGCTGTGPAYDNWEEFDASCVGYEWLGEWLFGANCPVCAARSGHHQHPELSDLAVEVSNAEGGSHLSQQFERELQELLKEAWELATS